MKKVVIIIALIGFLSLNATPFAMAAEINPTPGTYGFGSTSEFSQSMRLGQGSSNNNSGNLASTGQNQMLGYLAVGLLLIGAGAVAYLTLRKRKHASTTKTDQVS